MLEVIEGWTILEKDISKRPGYYFCQCNCGNIKSVYIRNIKKGVSKKCTDCARLKNIKHNMSKSKTYYVWIQMKERCHKPNHKWYHNYGAKGINVCDRWKNSFVNFIEDMGEAPEGYSIDRIDNYQGYSKENCRWVTRLEQDRNKRNSIHIGEIHEGWKIIRRLPWKHYEMKCISCEFSRPIKSCNFRRIKKHQCEKRK